MGTTGLPEGDDTPDVAELQGREAPGPMAPLPTMQVAVEGVVRTQRLPNRSWAVRQTTITNTGEPTFFLKEDLTRARVTLRAVGGDVYVAPNRDQVQAGFGLLPDGATLQLDTTGPIYAFGADPAVTLVAYSEHWTD